MTETVQWARESLRRQRAKLSRLIEPGDLLGILTVQTLGPEQAYTLITSGSKPADNQQQAVGEAAETAGLGPRQRRLGEGLQRWRTRLSQIGGSDSLKALHKTGGGILVPEDTAWPRQLGDLGPAEPLALWFRCAGPGDDPYQKVNTRLPRQGRSAALVGSREMTDYGGRVAWEVAAELAGHGVSIISGGAYGIDAAAHRGALAAQQTSDGERLPAGSPTLAVLAGGVDKLYPAGNERLLHAVLESGLVLSELAPGSAPTRHRFLQRNRIIAALAEVTVVVEARWRSGAQSTAHHALSLGRPVGAVPGPVTSPSSAGCHRLLRETPTQLITDAAEVMELVAGAGEPAVCPPRDARAQTAGSTAQTDGLNQVEKLLYDALPVSRSTSIEKLCEVAGLPVPQVLAGMTRLQRHGLASGAAGRWKRT